MILPIVTALSPRGLRPDAGRPTRRARSPSAPPLGDDPHRRAAVRPARRHLRLDARPRPRARRDDRRHHPRLELADGTPWTLLVLQRRRDLRLARSPTTPPSSTARRRPARSSPPVWCSSSSPSSSTRSPGSSSSAGRPSPNEHRRRERRSDRDRSRRRSTPGPRRAPRARPSTARGRARGAPRTSSPGSSCGSPSSSPSSRWSGSCGPSSAKGVELLLESTWWTNSPARHHAPPTSAAAPTTPSRARCMQARGHRADRRCRSASSPRSTSSSTAAAGSPGRSRFMVDILTGVPVDRRGAVHLRRVGDDVRLPAGRASPSALALVLLMIPVVVRSTEEMLKLVPERAARGVLRPGRARSGRPSCEVVLPTAFSGIVTGVLLGLARVMGETAPLLILGPYTKIDRHEPLRRPHGRRCRR